MNINSKLVTFAQQELVLARNDTERDGINRSLSHLETVLHNKLSSNIKEFVHFGSYTRNTILPRQYDPQSDVDLMVVFNTVQNKYTPGTYRKWLLDAVSSAYPNSVSKKDFPVVKLELNHIMFDIVPAYCEESYWSGKSYYIPSANDRWQSTVPNDINQPLSDKNQQCGNNTVRNVIRLCKHWNANAGYPLYSYLMEKQIINLSFWNVDTYNAFLNTMSSIAGNRAGVKQALDYINQYKGNWYTQPNEQKQFEWLQKLLPKLTLN
jgi:predicted nucleotidyltransferase